MNESANTVEIVDFTSRMRLWKVIHGREQDVHWVRLRNRGWRGGTFELSVDDQACPAEWESVDGESGTSHTKHAEIHVNGKPLHLFALRENISTRLGTHHIYSFALRDRNQWSSLDDIRDPGRKWTEERNQVAVALLFAIASIAALKGMLRDDSSRLRLAWAIIALISFGIIGYHLVRRARAMREGLTWKSWLGDQARKETGTSLEGTGFLQRHPILIFPILALGGGVAYAFGEKGIASTIWTAVGLLLALGAAVSVARSLGRRRRSGKGRSR